jgi:hypothetical protein
MGVFSKLSGFFGGSSAKKAPAATRPAASGIAVPVGGTTPGKAASSAATGTSSPTSTNPSGFRANGQAAAGTATALRPGRDPVAIDLSDDSGEYQDSFNADSKFSGSAAGSTGTTQGSTSSTSNATAKATNAWAGGVQSPSMIGTDANSDVPPPPPAYYTQADSLTTGRRNQPNAYRDEEAIEPIRTPRNKQELVEELQKSYAEVVTLIRKVDGHLDSQDKRSERLLTIAETLPAALEDLSEVRRQHAQLAEAIDRLTQATREGTTKSESSRAAQLETLGEVRTLLQSAGDHERRVADSLDEFKGSIVQVATSTDKLGAVLEGMDSRQQRRENDLRQAIESGQKWMATAVVLGIVCLGIVVVAGVLAFA